MINKYATKQQDGYSSSLSNEYLDFCGRSFLNVLSGGAVLLLISSLPVSVPSVCVSCGAVVGYGDTKSCRVDKNSIVCDN